MSASAHWVLVEKKAGHRGAEGTRGRGETGGFLLRRRCLYGYKRKWSRKTRLVGVGEGGGTGAGAPVYFVFYMYMYIVPYMLPSGILSFFYFIFCVTAWRLAFCIAYFTRIRLLSHFLFYVLCVAGVFC